MVSKLDDNDESVSRKWSHKINSDETLIQLKLYSHDYDQKVSDDTSVHPL